MDSANNEVTVDFSPLLRVYKNGRVERIFGSPIVPPSPEDPTTGVASKDIDISPDIKARIYLPKVSTTTKLPILVYFHGGGFCLESAFSSIDHRYLNLVVSQSKVVAVSVEYRLAPEHPLPVAYHDSWSALQWIGSQKEAWLVKHGDFNKLVISGDSAGANIAHHLLLRSGIEGGIRILAAILCFPYFMTSKDFKEDSLPSRIWNFVNPTAEDGVDDPKINPFVEKALSLSGLGCSKILVCIAEKDELRNIGIQYVEAVKKSGWKGELELIDVQDEDHCFQLFNTETQKARDLIKAIANFVKQL